MHADASYILLEVMSMPYVPPEKIQALKKWMKGNWFDYFRYCLPELDEAVDEHPEHVPCPVHGGSDGFRLFDDAEETGGGICNTCGGFRDGIALTQFIRGCTFIEAVELIEEWRQDQEDDDVDDDPPERPDKLVKPVEYSKYAIRYIDKVIALAITPHERIKRYFMSRGLTVDPPDCLGLMLNETYRDDYDDLELPVMVALFHNLAGDPVCVHRTFLDDDGDGKADVASPKKFSPAIFRGAMKGCAIQLRPYSNGLLGIAEGIETSEAIYQATKISTWAAGSAGNMASFIPPDDITKLCIWADNDERGVGLGAAEKLRERLKGRNIRVKIFVPPVVGNDWLDVLMLHGESELLTIAKKSQH
jgi:putative DNA primase/helicase